MVLPRQTGTRSAPGGSRTAGPARPVGQPGYPSGWPPASAPVACHAARVEDGGSERQGRGKRTFAPTFGPLEFCGRLKDLLGEQIHATRNPGRTREQIAEILGTTAREVEKKVGGASHRPALHEVPAFVSVLGDDVLHELAGACGGVFIRLPDVGDEGVEGSLLDLLLDAQDAAGGLASALSDARRRQSPGGAGITADEAQRIEAAGLATLRSYQVLMLTVCGRRGGQ